MTNFSTKFWASVFFNNIYPYNTNIRKNNRLKEILIYEITV